MTEALVAETGLTQLQEDIDRLCQRIEELIAPMQADATALAVSPSREHANVVQAVALLTRAAERLAAAGTMVGDANTIVVAVATRHGLMPPPKRRRGARGGVKHRKIKNPQET